MRYLVYGRANSRDFLIYRRLSTEVGEDNVFCCFGSSSTFLRPQSNHFNVGSHSEALDVCRKTRPDVVILQSIIDIEAGAADAFEDAGYRVFGVRADAAMIERQKSLAKEFMARHGIPTAKATRCESPDEAQSFLTRKWVAGRQEFVIKADANLNNAYYGTAVPGNLEEAIQFARLIFSALKAKRLPEFVLLEEKLSGPELSLHVLTDGKDYVLWPMVKDYKRYLPGDLGPNTGGMGAIASSTEWPSELYHDLIRRIVRPSLNGLHERWPDYRYFLYIGIMLTNDGPKVLEYNARPGAPEVLPLLHLLTTPVSDVIDAVLCGRLRDLKCSWDRESSCSAALMLAGAGYPFLPHSYPAAIYGFEKVPRDVIVCPESVRVENGVPYTNGGRVLALLTKSRTFSDARRTLVKAAQELRFNGMFYRDDIGKGGLRLGHYAVE